jgi:cysteine synthase
MDASQAIAAAHRPGRGRVFDGIVDAIGDTPINRRRARCCRAERIRRARSRASAHFVPDILDRAVIDEIVKVNSATALQTSRVLARHEGIPGGISSGAVIAAVLQIGKRPEAVGKTILAIVPSFAERYLSTALFEGI